MPKIDERLRMLIVGKMKDGSSLRNVSTELNICKTIVRNIWNTFWDTGPDVDTGLLSRNAINEPFLSAHNLGVQSNLISMVSVRTVRRYLHKSGLSARVSARKPLLSKLSCLVKRRIQWCKAYSSFEATDWNQVSFLFLLLLKYYIYLLR